MSRWARRGHEHSDSGARPRPTLAGIEAFVRQPRSEDHDQAALAAAGAAIA
jgi:hypothetical protein